MGKTVQFKTGSVNQHEQNDCADDVVYAKATGKCEEKMAKLSSRRRLTSGNHLWGCDRIFVGAQHKLFL